MKKKSTKALGEMRAEYDFSGGIRGKYCKSRLRGYIIRVHGPKGKLLVTNVQRQRLSQ